MYISNKQIVFRFNFTVCQAKPFIFIVKFTFSLIDWKLCCKFFYCSMHPIAKLSTVSDKCHLITYFYSKNCSPLEGTHEKKKRLYSQLFL